MNEVLRLEGVSKAFHGRTILPSMDLTVTGGEVIGIMGPSGVGKSTLLHLAAGLQRPTGGRISINTRRIGFVFQEHRLLPWHTALHNVILPQLAVGTARTAARSRAIDLLGEMGMGEALDTFPDALSGGMRQRVSLARALAVNPELLLLDEPFTGFDHRLRDTIRSWLNDHLQDNQTAVLQVTHDRKDLLAAVNRTIVLPMEKGLKPY